MLDCAIQTFHKFYRCVHRSTNQIESMLSKLPGLSSIFPNWLECQIMRETSDAKMKMLLNQKHIKIFSIQVFPKVIELKPIQVVSINMVLSRDNLTRK